MLLFNGIIITKKPHMELYMIIQHDNFGRLMQIRRGIHEPTHNYGEHIHQFCEYVLVMDGELEMVVDGEKYTVEAGEMVVVAPFQVHSFHTPEKAKIWICVFSNDFIIPMVQYGELCMGRDSSVFKPSEILLKHLYALDFINRKSTDYNPIKDYEEFHVYRSAIYMIYAEYLRATKAGTRNASDNVLSSVLTYISTHYMEPLTLESIGRELGYSPKYISNCFSILPNLNFRSMLNMLRVESAKNLLINTDLDNKVIADQCGFSGQTSFHRAFQTIVGMTPREYKKQKEK